jgi:hypothetical protein
MLATHLPSNQALQNLPSADPSQPLLAPGKPVVERTPVPKLQLATVFLVRLAEPIAVTQLFPYINEYIHFLRVTDDPSQIGFYSGLGASYSCIDCL